MPDFSTLVSSRHSCRRYQENRIVPRETLDACFEASRLAPSACNSQPWRFIAVDTPEGVAALAPCVQKPALNCCEMNKFASGCSALVVVAEAPAILMRKLSDKPFDQTYAQMDVGIAAAHFVLAAAEHGLSTCILGWLDAEKIRAVLSLPEEETPRLVIAVGYAEGDAASHSTPRKPLDEIRRYAEPSAL